MTNAPGDPGRVVLRPEPCLLERTCRTRDPDDQHSRKSWLRRVEAGAPVRQSEHTVLEIQDGQHPRKSWSRCVEAGASVCQNERVVPEIQMTNTPGNPGRVASRPEPPFAEANTLSWRSRMANAPGNPGCVVLRPEPLFAEVNVPYWRSGWPTTQEVLVRLRWWLERSQPPISDRMTCRDLSTRCLASFDLIH